MRGPYAELLLVFGLLCTGTTVGFALNKLNSEVGCTDEERQVLLKFKQGLQDDYHLLSSWGSHEEDCCKWKGVECSNRTGYVVKLDLRQSIDSELEYLSLEYLSGEISSSILGLQHLTYLDLSLNNFSILPEFIGSLAKLQYLNLSYNAISGTIPQQLGNLSSLISLDLSWNFGLIEGYNLDWLLHLSSLKHLDMSSVNLSKVANWPDKVNMLPSLLDLHLSACELSMPIPFVLSNTNSSSQLSIIDLSHNNLNSSVFSWLFKYTNSLLVLYLNDNALGGSIPKAFGDTELHNLQVLDFSKCSISGEVPNLTKMSQLQVLDMSSNSLEGVITEAHLWNISTLSQLDFSSNSLSLKFSPAWVPPFHLDTIKLGSCKLGPAFPQWLQTQNLVLLDISDAGISDSIPNWFWDLTLGNLNLSHNNITGTIPPQWFLSRFGGFQVDLSYNRFNGLLPQLNFFWAVLHLSNNMFEGSIKSICETNGSMSDFTSLYLSLDLSYNFLSGELPNCWTNMTNLFSLNLANNRLSGRIPDSMGSLHNLHALHLQDNDIIGELPKSLTNYSSLKLLDVGENRLSGPIPAWIGTSLPHLVVLRLPSNLFNGSIPLQLCELTSLQILDLSHNKITGPIPRCLNSLAAMLQKQSSNVSIAHDDYSGKILIQFYMPYYIDNLMVIFKEKTLEYSKTLGLVKLIDLSSNKLKGEIPREITSLSGLLGLNLSGNFLTGIIPLSIGDMKILESLDLSRNHLSGVIPQSLTTLSFLSYLNLSNNNLSGRIPSSTQLQSFNASAYAANRDLCGLPLLKRCLGDEAVQGLQPAIKNGEGIIQEHANFYEHLGLYTSIALGFIVGFWGVCGLLLLKSSWRHAYFQYLDRIGDWFYLTTAIKMAKFMRIFKTWRYKENI